MQLYCWTSLQAFASSILDPLIVLVDRQTDRQTVVVDKVLIATFNGSMQWMMVMMDSESLFRAVLGLGLSGDYVIICQVGLLHNNNDDGQWMFILSSALQCHYICSTIYNGQFPTTIVALTSSLLPSLDRPIDWSLYARVTSPKITPITHLRGLKTGKSSSSPFLVLHSFLIYWGPISVADREPSKIQIQSDRERDT